MIALCFRCHLRVLLVVLYVVRRPNGEVIARIAPPEGGQILDDGRIECACCVADRTAKKSTGGHA